MKSSKSALKASIQEECGVWLDAGQLKEKAKRKGVTRLISKMFNPVPGGGRYTFAGALNVTPTKMQMQKSKQISISTFFTPQHKKAHNKKTTSEAPNVNPALPPSLLTPTTCASTAPTPEPCGTKRRRELDLDFLDSEPGVVQEEKNENVSEEMWQEQAASCTYSNDKHEFEEENFEEIHPPHPKRRSTRTSLSDDSQPLPQAWSQDPVFKYNQYSNDEFCQSNLKIPGKDLCDSDPSYFNSFKSERDFIDCMGVNVKTSTQKSPFDRESSSVFSSQSPRKPSLLSHFGSLSNQKWTEPKSALHQQHIPVHLWKMSDEEDNLDSQFKWTKPSSPSLKKLHQSCRAVDEDSPAMLFTQDSEGFRVIAHRSVHVRSPFKDQSNINTRTVRIVEDKTVTEDDEDEMLFTQDSQGNLVIRH